MMTLSKLKDKLNFSSYNTGSQTVTGEELEKTVKNILPNAEIYFDENQLRTPLIDDQDDSRIRKEIDFNFINKFFEINSKIKKIDIPMSYSNLLKKELCFFKLIKIGEII